jgi:hypothetical protein
MAKTSTTDRARKQALDQALRGMFGALQARPVPNRLTSIVEQLEAGDLPAAKKKAG